MNQLEYVIIQTKLNLVLSLLLGIPLNEYTKISITNAENIELNINIPKEVKSKLIEAKEVAIIMEECQSKLLELFKTKNIIH